MVTIFLKRVSETVPDISIIVVFPSFPNFNIDRLVNSTKRISLKYEIILVVNEIKALEKKVQESLMALFEGKSNFISLRLVLMGSSNDRSAAFGRNLGAMLAESPILVFADDDSVVLDDLASPVKRLKNGECYGIQPLILKLADMEIIDSAGDFTRYMGKMHAPKIRYSGDQFNKRSNDLYLEEVSSLRGAFMLVRKDAFLAVGGMDNSFIFVFEDVDLGWRMTCAGYTLLFDPEIRELHKGSRTSSETEVMTEKVFRLWLLNLYSLNLKVIRYRLWPYVFLQFQKYMLLYEFAGVKTRGVTPLKLVTNIFRSEKNFLTRFKQARVHRSILSKKLVVSSNRLAFLCNRYSNDCLVWA